MLKRSDIASVDLYELTFQLLDHEGNVRNFTDTCTQPTSALACVIRHSYEIIKFYKLYPGRLKKY